MGAETKRPIAACGPAVIGQRVPSHVWRYPPSRMSDDLRIVTTVSNEAEAEMVAERLSEAGIRHMARMAGGGIRLGAAAARDVYVEERDLDRAREVLKVDEGFSDEELARLSDEAGKAALDETP
jgi:Putative prokaryotic signal transducing protein